MEIPHSVRDQRDVGEDSFPILEGEKMCLRCKCCQVGVAPYGPPVQVGRLRIGFLPEPSSLLPEPSGHTSGELEAWFCKGGCDDNGQHGQKPMPATFICYVKKAERP